MGERKVLNKYFPPDFDPKLVPKTKWDPYKQIETRMMLPFNIQCETCGEFMYRGKKFNMRKEDVIGDTYKGIKKFRFYMKCNMCNREITFITDPENMDYAMEHGAKRLFEIWKEQEKMEKDAVARREAEEKADAMKALEHRTIDSKLEMDIMDALEETKAMSAKRDAIKHDDLIAMVRASGGGGAGGGDTTTAAAAAAAAGSTAAAATAEQEEEEEEAALIAQAFGKAGKTTTEGNGAGGGGKAKPLLLRKLDDSDEEEGEGEGTTGGGGGPTATLVASVAAAAAAAREKEKGAFKPVIAIKAKPIKKTKKRKAEGKEEDQTTTKKQAATKAAAAPPQGNGGGGGGALLGLAGYGSSSSEED